MKKCLLSDAMELCSLVIFQLPKLSLCKIIRRQAGRKPDLKGFAHDNKSVICILLLALTKPSFLMSVNP